MSSSAEYFENSKQRGEIGIDIYGAVLPSTKREEETFAMVQLNFPAKKSFSICSGFFVQNTEGKALIATANHCGGSNIAQLCEKKGFVITTHYGDLYGKCEKIVASVPGLDMYIFEAKIEKWDFFKDKGIRFLRLSSQKPRLNTRVKVMGYPSDRRRFGALTISDNCWVNDYPMLMPTDLTDEEQLIYQEYKSLRKGEAKIEYKKLSAAFINCSVYGGNSGGPVLIEGTDIALGMPTRYWPTLYRTISSQLSTSMNATADFIEAAKDQLVAAGVVFAEPYSSGTYVPPYYLKKTSDEKQTCHRTSAGQDSAPVDDVYCNF